MDKWLPVSIFYNGKNWGKLLNSGVRSLIEKINQRGPVDFILFFSTEQGDHIRLLIKIPADEQKEYMKDCYDVLNAFVTNNSSTAPARGRKINLFRNFPNNSVWFNLFKLRAAKSKMIGNLPMYTFLSQEILKTMGEFEFTEADILSYYYRFLFRILKCYHGKRKRTLSTTFNKILLYLEKRDLKRNISYHITDKSIAKFKIKLKVLPGFFPEKSSADPSQQLLVLWEEKCYSFLRENSGLAGCSRIISILNEHFNVRGELLYLYLRTFYQELTLNGC